MTLTIGVDVGGTKIAGGLVNEAGTVLAQVKRETPSLTSPTAAILDVIRELGVGAGVVAVGLGVPGFVDEHGANLLFAPNLMGWRDVPLKDIIEQEVGLPVVLENDANAAAWGEAAHGGGRNERNLVCITLGTGTGGGLILNGQLYRGRWGFGGELGHMQVEPGGRPCGCGQSGCWEQYVNGAALLREARQRASQGDREGEMLLAFGDGTLTGLTSQHVTAAGRMGNSLAVSAFEAIARWLGQGLADLAAVLDPGCFVIGGGMSDAGDLLLAPTREAFAAALTARRHRPHADIRRAQLGNAAGIVGAADLAREGHGTPRVGIGT